LATYNTIKRSPLKQEELVLLIGLRTNCLPHKWDTLYYVDMAQNGVSGNRHLAAPFAYRPAAPLLIHSLALMLHANPQMTFRWCNRLMCVVFIVSCYYYFCRFLNAAPSTASLASALVSLYFFTVRWTIFSGEMVDIYAYPLSCFLSPRCFERGLMSASQFAQPGCSLKKFCSYQMLTQAVLAIRQRRRKKGLTALLSTTALVLFICFLLPRL